MTTAPNELRHGKKHGYLGFRRGPTYTEMYSHIRWLDDSGSKKIIVISILCKKKCANQMCSYCAPDPAFVFVYAKSKFSYYATHVICFCPKIRHISRLFSTN